MNEGQIREVEETLGIDIVEHQHPANVTTRDTVGLMVVRID